MSTVAERVLNAALEYATRGWRVLPLREGKIPRLKAWQRAATADAETIERWWQEHPGDNVGVRLGEASGVIDVECDSAEAEKMLLDLFNGDPPVTPTWIAKRGKHRLFRWRADLPHPENAVFKFGPLEFRTGNGDKGAQSVFPPSIHPSGMEYKWLVPPDECDIADLTDEVIAYLTNCPDGKLPSNGRTRTPEFWRRVSQGVSEGERNETAAQWIGRLLADLKDPFNADSIARNFELVRSWNERNRPPLVEKELSETYHSILRRHQAQHANDYADKEINQHRPTDPTTPVDEDKKTGWKIVSVQSRPRIFRLYSPFWNEKTEHGYIELNSSQIRNAEAIAVAAAEIDVWLPKWFSKVWHGSKGQESLGQQLMDTAEKIPAPFEAKRDLVVAGLLLERLERADVLKDGAKPDTEGFPVQLQDGRVIFKFNRVYSPMSMPPHRVTSGELLRVLEAVGIKEGRVRTAKYPDRFRVVTPELMDKIRVMTGLGADETGGVGDVVTI